MVAIVKNETQPKIDAGETKWKGRVWKLLRIKFIMIFFIFCLFFTSESDAKEISYY